MINLKAIIEIGLAVLFSLFIGAGGIKLATTPFKKETLRQVSKGIGSLESFSSRLTQD